MDWGAIGGFVKDILPVASVLGATYAEKKGSEEYAEGLEKGEVEQAKIERAKRQYAQKIFDEDIERQKPFYDAGIKAGLVYGDAITNKFDPTTTGAYKTKLGMLEPDLKGAPEYVREGAISRLGAIEGEKTKGRLLDLQKIGLGSAGQAGTSSLNLGNVLEQSYGLMDRVGTETGLESKNIRQSAWNTAVSNISGLPAYMESRTPAQPQPQPQAAPNLSNMMHYGGR